MLTAFKEFLHGIIPLLLYLAIFATVFLAAAKRAQWGLMLLVAIIANANVWYHVHQFPMGQNTMDFLVIATFIGIAYNNGGFDRAPRTVLIGAYVLMLYLALWNSSLRFGLPLPFTPANPLLADLKNYVEMLLLYFLAYNAFKNEEDQKKTIVLIAIVVLLVCVREIRNFDTGASFSYDKRAAGPFWVVGLGANHFGAFLAYVGVFFCGLFLVDKHPIRKWLYLVTIACMVYPLFSTFSRGAYGATVVALTVLGLLHKRSLLIGIAALVIMWQTVLPPAMVERITMTESADGQIEESAALRFVVWERAKELFYDNPVFGVGFQGFSVSVNVHGLNNPHSFYMQTAAEEGVIGLLFLAMIFMRSAVSGFRLYRIGKSDLHRGMGLGMVAAVVAMIVTNIFGDRWSYFALGSYFWIFWGMVDRSIKLAETANVVVPATADTQPAVATPRRATA